jgi:hypothetical protein
MTQTQIIALVGVALAAAWSYGPQLKSLLPDLLKRSRRSSETLRLSPESAARTSLRRFRKHASSCLRHYFR